MNAYDLVKYLLATTTFFAFAACGGGGGGSPVTPAPRPVLNGVFIDSAVQGLNYQTATLSGLTDANGEFSYRQGESVTFSLGGITLGTAAGATRITPFDLFGLTPPSTELELRTEMKSVNKVTDFDRVVNISLLLATLDDDGDLENGINLGDWNTRLAGANLEFDENIGDFRGKRLSSFARTYGARRDSSIVESIVHLYDSLDISVPAHVLSRGTRDDGNDGSIDEVVFQSHNARGQIVSSGQDFDGNGVAELTNTYTFDANGNLTTSSVDRDTNQDGVIDSINVTTYTYDAIGNRVRTMHEKDPDNDGVIDAITTEIFTYDANNNQLSRFRAEDTDGDGNTDNSERIVRSFSPAGDLVLEITDFERDADGVVDEQITVTQRFDSRSNRTNREEEYDLDADGTPERRINTRYEYDENGFRTLRVIETDANADGTLDDIFIETRSYDSKGNRLIEREEQDDDGNGKINNTWSEIHTYDSAGNRLTTNGEVDEDGDGIIDRSWNSSSVYDVDSNRLSKSSSLTDARTGDLLSSSVENDTFDTNSNRLTSFYEADQDGDGGSDTFIDEHFSYSQDGNLESRLLQQDEKAGVAREFTERHSYTVIKDGLHYLTSEYFLFYPDPAR